jgi:hypothetical protein
MNRSQIFGALLDRVVCGLRQLPQLRLTRLPRMADFGQWSVATEAFPSGVFIAAFERAVSEANETVAETDPVAIAVAAFMMGRDHWSGTAAELLRVLSNHDRAEAQPSAWKTWPREPSSFGKKIRLATPVLRKKGVEVVVGKATDHVKTRTITLSKIDPLVHPQQAARPGMSDSSDTSRAVTKVA